jgi:prepilin-type N-terminal cleavage/methylation domain-containing protein
MIVWAQKRTGFTIVELLIVVVVIAILAAITTVAYAGIRERALTTKVQSELSQANKAVAAYAVIHGGQYPNSLADTDAPSGGDTTFQYTYDNTTSPRTYAITASNGVAGSIVYHVSSSQSTVSEGIAPGHNLAEWKEPETSTAPITISTGVAVDTSRSRSAPASIRLSAGATGKTVRGSEYSGQPGQTLTVSAWIRTDSNWNGRADNSKIRFGHSGGLAGACGYNGVKTNWTFVTCSRPFTSTYTSYSVSFGNDGTVGSVWVDDVNVSIK